MKRRCSLLGTIGVHILSVAFSPRNPRKKIIESFRAAYGDDYYVCRFQEPGKMEGEFAELKSFLTYRHRGPLFLPKGKMFGHAPYASIILPSWLTEENVRYYTSKSEKTWFTGAINYYRNFDLNWELNAPWTGAKVKVPVKFIIGDHDLTYNSYNSKTYIHNGGFKKDVPLLEDVVVMEGVAHFLNQEKPDEISKHIYDFIQQF